MSPPGFDLTTYRSQLAALAERGVYLGTSSWKYLGWLGQVYQRDRYEYRGKFAESRFERDCLREYAETFKTVCVDAAYYTFPSEKNLQGLADQVPDDFRFAFKVTDEVTMRRYPKIPRFGERGGTINENFLNAPLFIQRFLQPLVVLGAKVGPIIFEFSRFYASDFSKGSEFVAALDAFLGALPKEWTYSVELRNEKWLASEYLECLRRHNVAHVFNNWTDMPPISEQLNLVGDLKTDRHTVARFLLRPGRPYEEAVKKFQPYQTTQELNENARGAGYVLINGALSRPARNGTYLYVNNRLEGNAINTIAAFLAKFPELSSATRTNPASPAPAIQPPPSPATGAPKDQLQLGL